MALLETIGLLSVFVFLLYLYLTRKNNYWAKRNIVFEKPVPVFGNFLDTITVKRNAGQVVTDTYRKYKGEKVVGMFNFTEPCLLVRDPILINQVLTTNFHQFRDNAFELDEDVDPVLSKNVFVQTGEKWKKSRQRLSPAFTVGKVKTTFDKIQTVAQKLVKYLEEHPEGEVKWKMSLFTSEMVAAWGIGIDGHSFDSDNPVLPKLGKLMFEPSLKLVLNFTLFSFAPKLAKLLRVKFTPDEVPQFFDVLLRDIIKSRREGSAQHLDFLQYFIDLQKRKSTSTDETEQVTDDDIMVAVVSFFLEGYETSSIVLSHMLYELCKSSEIQSRLREEMDQLWEKSASGIPTYEDIVEAPLLSRVYLEANRMYGGVVLTKLCTETCALDIGDGKFVNVEKGTTIHLPLGGVQSDPEYWDSPKKFNPDRFIDFVPQKGTYFPFGEGPRMCIGMRIANASIKAAAAHIIRNFELVPTKDTAPEFVQEPKHFMSMMKGGIHFRFVKRNLK